MKSSRKKKMYHIVYISTQKSNMFQNCFTRKDMPLSLPNLNTSTLFCFYFFFSFPSFCFKKYREFVIINYRAIFSRIYNTLLSSRPHKYSKIPSNHTSRPVKQEERLPTLFWAFTVSSYLTIKTSEHLQKSSATIYGFVWTTASIILAWKTEWKSVSSKTRNKTRMPALATFIQYSLSQENQKKKKINSWESLTILYTKNKRSERLRKQSYLISQQKE